MLKWKAYRLFCALIPAVVVITGTETIAQPAKLSRPQFEVAAVKLGDARLGAQMKVSGRRLVWANITLRDVIEPAYHIGDWQIQGAPSWMDSDPFAFEAVMPEGYSVRGTPFGDERLMAMMQSLIEDRFKLKFHWQPKEGKVYSLAVAKDGPRLKPSEGEDSQDPNLAAAGVSYRRGFMKGKRATMAQFAQGLSDVLERPVEDQTGIHSCPKQLYSERPRPIALS